jgi:hypothetical protein
MSQPEILSTVVRARDRAGIKHMLTGSLVTSMQGVPRSTHDIDIVVAMRPEDIPAVAGAFAAPEFYLSEQAMRQAIASGGMFNLIETRSGDKVDFWLLTDDPFDTSRFARRVRDAFGDLDLWVSSPEDTILMKLRWATDSPGSVRHFNDALMVYEVQSGNLDLAYIESWATRLGVDPLWRRLIGEAMPPNA